MANDKLTSEAARIRAVSLLSIVIILVAVQPCFAQDDNQEVPLPYVTLVQPPAAGRVAEESLSDERRREIDLQIRNLARLESRDIGLLKYSPDTHVFVPIGKFDGFGHLTDRNVETLPAIRRLVEIGPEAIPMLLDALGDDTPTDLVVTAIKSMGPIAGGMEFDEILHGNPANPSERFILNLKREPYSASIRPRPQFFVANEIEQYRVKVGDVCFVIVGQIVGRDYECLYYNHVKSLGVLVCSPVHRESIRDRVRRIWNTEHPRQKVFESLLVDFSTRGLLQMDSLDYWDIGNDFQVASAMRLLHYYPDLASPLIASRLADLKADGDYVDDCIANGVRADDLVDAIGWSDAKRIRDSLRSMARRATDRGVMRALARSGVDIDRIREEPSAEVDD